jgi:signal transduction histidine kinase
MRNLGVFLIYAAVILRVVARFAQEAGFGMALGLLAVCGSLLLLEPYTVERLPQRLRASGRWKPLLGRLIPWAYLLVQMGLVVALLYLPPHLDFFAGLFAPLSLQAVELFGWQVGLVWIVAFTAALPSLLSAAPLGWPYALVMTLFWGGVNLLFGGYAYQVHKAREIRRQNDRLLADLQAAYRQQQSYTPQVEDLASEQARSRLARALHESVAQTVFSMNLTIQAARMMAKEPGRAAGQLKRLEDLAASAMGEIQLLVSQLRPRAIVEEGLPAALQRLADEWKGRGGLEVSVAVIGADDARPLPEQVEVGLYRIAQEALRNVSRHAGTKQAAIRLDVSRKPPSLCIEDPGRGFDPRKAAGQRGRLGLAGMAERARELGWRLTVDSAPGRGTRLLVEEGAATEATQPVGARPAPAQPGEAG